MTIESPPVLRTAHPAVPGVREVLRAHFPPRSHAYPMHTHDAWTLLLVDEGAVSYRLDGGSRLATRGAVTLLPPHVPHDGHAASADGFRKRVVYLEPEVLAGVPLDAVLRSPDLPDPGLVGRVGALHERLEAGHEPGAVETLLHEVSARLVERWGGPVTVPADRLRGYGEALRLLLDSHVVEGLSLAEAAARLGVAEASLARAFRREVGTSPHRYLVDRRLERARRLLLEGRPAAVAAVAAGFYDQAHLTRHFRRCFGVTPGSFARASR